MANAITKPFRDAYDGVAKQVDKIKRKAEELLHIDLPMGGEVAPAGGETGLIGNISPGQYMVNGNNNPIVIEDNIYLTLDLKNVPVGVDTNTLINALTDKNVVSALANNRDFQSMDAQVKQKLNLKQLRSGGI